MQKINQTPCAKFEPLVVENFGFLERDYGFVRHSVHRQGYMQSVLYNSAEVYVVISYGPPAYEPEMSFGRLGIDDVPGAYSFHPGDLIQLDFCYDWAWNKDHSNALASWVADLARLLATCGRQCLSNNTAMFAQMRNRRDKVVAEWKYNEENKVLREKVDLAWREKDYKRVLWLYRFLVNHSEIDKKRIAFAEVRR